jgi:mannose-6-phosphate isomerase
LAAPVVETTTPVKRERLFHCEQFRLSRLQGEAPFAVGAPDAPSVLVCIGGAGQIEQAGAAYAVAKGNVFLLPAAIGACTFQPRGAVSMLEIEIPE